MNGGMESGDEAVLDGITMQQGLMSQTGMISVWNDYPISPDSVSEVSVLTSNYQPQYGSDDLWHHHHGYEVRHERVSRDTVRIPAQYRPQCPAV